MSALANDKITPYRANRDYSDPVEANKLIYQGAMVGINAAGNAVPMTAVVGLVCRGIAQDRADNSTGAAGAINVPTRTGLFRVLNAGDIDRTFIGKSAYAVDDQTVSSSSNNGTRSVAGVIDDIDSIGVWVKFGDRETRKTFLSIDIPTLVAGGTYRTLAPIAGTIKKIWTVINGVLTTGNATLTGSIGATPITNGLVTVIQAGSAAGQTFTAVPTAANTVNAGDVISFAVGGTNATASTAELLVEIEY